MTFAQAILELKETLKRIKNRRLNKIQVLQIFTGEVENCPLCQANIEFGDDECRACPANHSNRSRTPCDRVKEATSAYRENRMRRKQFEKVFTAALAETEKNFQKETERVMAHLRALGKL